MLIVVQRKLSAAGCSIVLGHNHMHRARVLLVHVCQRFCRSAAVLRNGKLYQFETLEEAKRLYEYKA